jgi:hypothetical protein
MLSVYIKMHSRSGNLLLDTPHYALINKAETHLLQLREIKNMLQNPIHFS